MAYLKRDDLFKTIISSAIKDRISFIDCLCDGDPMINVTRIIIKRMTEISSYTFKSAMEVDKECVRLACLYSEMWYEGVADAHGGGREFKLARSMHKQVKSLRLKIFGLTKSESIMSKCVPTKINEIMSNITPTHKR